MKQLLTLLLFLTTLAEANLATLGKLTRAYEEKVKRWEQSVLAAETPELKTRILKERPDPRPTSETIMREIRPFLEEPGAIQSILWLYKYDPSFLNGSSETSPGKIIRTALERTLYKFPGAGELCVTISENFQPADMAFLEKVSTQSPSEQDQGLAALGISIALSKIGDNPELIQRRLKQLTKAIKLTPPDATLQGQNVMEIIDDQLYVIKHLTKGKKAPSFTGKDLGGRAVTWTGRNEKVTAIVFWNEKDIDRNSLLPVLQDTEKLLREVGGSMIGVYTGSRNTLSRLTGEQKVSWVNLFDETNEVSRKYRINITPTIVLLDKEGKIQSIGEPNALINLTIRALANTTE